MGFFSFFSKKKKNASPEKPNTSTQNQSQSPGNTQQFAPSMTKSQANNQAPQYEPDWEHQWMYEDLLQFLTSPLWKVPIYSFLDENCIVFDEEEENKFAYTEIHQKFIKVIEELVEGHLLELGISEELFSEILQRGLKNPEHRRTFEQLLIIDNFIVFKKLMVKRNKELEFEAMRQIEDEERKNTENSVNDELDVNRAGLESEAAEIEHALALSLALMTEHQKLMMEEERMLQEALKASEIEHNKHLEKQVAEQKAAERLAAEKIAREKAEKEKAEQLKKLQEEKSKAKDTPLGDEEKAALGLTASVEDKSKIKKVEEKKVDENVFDMVGKKAPKQKLEPLGDFGALSEKTSSLPPLNTGSKYDAMGLEELMSQKEKIETKLSEVKEAEKKVEDKESMEERKKRLKAQRDLILAKKKAEREKELQTYQEQNKIEPKVQEEPKDAKDVKVNTFEKSVSNLSSSTTETKANTEEAEKRANVMKKLKGDLI